jgi:starch synthase
MAKKTPPNGNKSTAKDSEKARKPVKASTQAAPVQEPSKPEAITAVAVPKDEASSARAPARRSRNGQPAEKQSVPAVAESVATPVPAEAEPTPSEAAPAVASSTPLEEPAAAEPVPEPEPVVAEAEIPGTAATAPEEAPAIAEAAPESPLSGEAPAAVAAEGAAEPPVEPISGEMPAAAEAVPAETPWYPEIEPEPPRMEPEPEYIPEPTAHEPVPEPQAHHPVPAIPSMFIVHITPELAPVAKVGGLADVVYGLCNEMEIRGNHVEIILPKYDCLRYDHIWGLCETYRDLWVPWYGGAIHCTVFFGFVHGRKCFFIEPHSSDNFFNRGSVYGFNDDVMRFAFFSRAAIEFLWKSGKNPDIIHCHDWQTALVPVFLYEIYQFLGLRHPRVCYTIHNFKHQGVTGGQLLQATGLNRPEYYLHYDRLRDNHNPHALNLMKGGVVYSNFVTTVSPRHAVEAKDQGQGFGLEPTLHIHHGKYGGVVNGIDYNVWNPEIDRYIPHHYGFDNLDDKYHNKRALRHRLMIADNEKPIVAFVGRLDPQKGLELIRHAIFYTLHRRGQFVLLGSSPDGQINNYFWSLKHQLNDNPDVHIEIGFNEELSHLIYAGADMILVPSRFEPCGLTQLIALRYGTVPVVREVGGLADTVFDKDYSHKPLHERNGYVFRDYDNAGLESALGRAISCYYEFPEHFRELMKNALRYDYSWKNPGQDYLNIYDYIREK